MESGLTKLQQTLVICALFIVGVAYYLLDFNIYILLVFFGILVFLLIKNTVKNLFFILCFAAFLLGIIYTDARIPQPGALYKKAPAKMELVGRIITEPRKDLKSKTKFYFQTEQGKTLVTIYDYKRKFESLQIGDMIKIKGSVKHPYPATNPGQFDYGKYLRNKGVFTLTYVNYKSWEKLKSANSGIWLAVRKLSEVRNTIISVHARHLKSPKLEVLGGMVFGDYAVPAPEEIERDFINSGLLHLLAASGLNVGIIFGIWYFIASRLGVAFRTNIIAGMILVAVYSLMTGLPPSVTRAALMLEFVLIGKLLDRQADSTILLVMVAALMLLFNPLMLSDVGFQLSFIVTLGLLLFSRFFTPANGVVLIPLVAQVFASPIQIFHFNTFPIYSVLANMAVMPFVGIISFAGFAGSIFALVPYIGEKICFLADKIAEPFIIVLLYVSNFVSGLPGALQYLPTLEISLVIAFYAMVVLFLYSRKGAAIACLILLILLFKENFNKNLEFVFFDVGQGDSVLISTPDNRHIIVDTGPSGRYSPAITSIIPYLRDKGINTLDALVMTHPDSDHIGGTVDILKEIKVKAVYHNGVEDDTKIYRMISDYIKENAVNSIVLKDSDIIKLSGDLIINVIRPNNSAITDDNEDSIMLYLVYKEFSALLMGDCEAGSLDEIDDVVKKPVDLLKVGHHCSRNSVDDELLECLNPAMSVVSVGAKGVQYGHPSPQALSLLEKFKSKVLRTDKDYAIKIITDGYKIDLNKFGDKTWK